MGSLAYHKEAGQDDAVSVSLDKLQGMALDAKRDRPASYAISVDSRSIKGEGISSATPDRVAPTPSPPKIGPSSGSDLPVASLDEQLTLVGLGKGQLTDLGRERLRTIAAVSEKLGLATTDKSVVLAAVSDLRQRQWRAEDTKTEITAVGSKVKAELDILRNKIEALGRVRERVEEHQSAEARVAHEKEQRSLRVELKSRNYIEELEQLEVKLQNCGYSEEISHDALVARSAQLTAKQAEIETLRRRLEAFADLPPDLDAATQVFAAKQAQLQIATKQFEEGLAQL